MITDRKKLNPVFFPDEQFTIVEARDPIRRNCQGMRRIFSFVAL